VGLDYGRRRIGVAVSDPTRTIASPHAVIDRPPGGGEAPDALVRLIDGLRPSTVVVGIPFQLDGDEGEMAREARAFATALRSRIDMPVVEWDERLSTVRAEREIRAMELPRKRRREKGIADKVAAALILDGYLRSRAES
jgi:putative Holliday junction resolvase